MKESSEKFYMMREVYYSFANAVDFSTQALREAVMYRNGVAHLEWVKIPLPSLFIVVGRHSNKPLER